MLKLAPCLWIPAGVYPVPMDSCWSLSRAYGFLLSQE